MPAKRNSLLSNGVNGPPPALPEKPQRRTEVQKAENTGTQMKDSGPTTGVIVCCQIYNVYHLKRAFIAVCVCVQINHTAFSS